jgi:excinuclease ABC subunit B
MNFKLNTTFKPKGDQPIAIAQLVNGLRKGYTDQVLLGVTGSGKTFTIANVIEQINKPTLVISHNKTLAAQLYSELSDLFPENAVCYFVSFYDYYQPEAYLPQTDTYIEKDCDINKEIDRLRLEATSALMTRKDVIVVASVSCIYSLGSPEDWQSSIITLNTSTEIDRDGFLYELIRLQYLRDDLELQRGEFRVRGDTIEVFPSHTDKPIRIELFGDKIEKMATVDPITKDKTPVDRFILFPVKHFITSAARLRAALVSIEEELIEREKWFKDAGKLIEAQRIGERTRLDLEMLQATGYCHGIENYSKHLSQRQAGERPITLIDYFSEDFLMVIDESHVSVPQINSMYEGDKARKKSLIDYGFRLPSAYDNRPLKQEEFWALSPQRIYLSATPAEYETKKSQQIVEQIIRPTGLVDPEIEVRKQEGQIPDLKNEIRQRAERKERTLVITLTKRMAEDLADYLSKEGLVVRYLHSEIDALKRVEILRDLRLGLFDCLVGINLLREGLDLPEVSLVVILDADKEGFLRSQASLIQVFGRCARHISGKVIMYADRMTGSMKRAIEETGRRRKIQQEYNRLYGITPKSIEKQVTEYLPVLKVQEPRIEYKITGDPFDAIEELEEEMKKAADNLEYERAAYIRDELFRLKKGLKKRV